MSSPSASQIQVRALDFGNSSATGPSPNKGTPVGHIPLEGTGSSKLENFLDTPIHTPPRSKSQSHFPCHRGWAMGRGKGVRREGAKSSPIRLLVILCLDVILG